MSLASARNLHNFPPDPRSALLNVGPAMTRQRIAVIEDEATIAGAIARRLEAEGFEVEVAGDGIGGVALCQRFRPTSSSSI